MALIKNGVVSDSDSVGGGGHRGHPIPEPCDECGTTKKLFWRYYGKQLYCEVCEPEECEDLL